MSALDLMDPHSLKICQLYLEEFILVNNFFPSSILDLTQSGQYLRGWIKSLQMVLNPTSDTSACFRFVSPCKGIHLYDLKSLKAQKRRCAYKRVFVTLYISKGIKFL